MDSINEQVTVLTEKLQGKVVITVKAEIWRKGEDDLKWAIVLKLTPTQAGKIVGLSTVLKRAWQMSKEVQFLEIPNDMLVAKFQTQSSLEKAWEGGLWTFMGDFVCMQRWHAGCEPALLTFDNLQIWLQIHRLPTELMNEGVAKGIAAVAGKVCKCVQQEAEVLKFRFFRVKVEVDLNQPE